MNEKNCTPGNCRHTALLEKARAACASCTSSNCTPDNCPHKALLEKARAACLDCPCGGKPAGHGGQVSIEEAGEEVINRERVYIDRSPRGTVTNLPPAIEEQVADLLRGWLDLSAIEVLLVHHICNGGTTKTFGEKLVRLREKITSMKPQRESARATAWAQWKSIMRRFPFMAKLQSWKPGHGGAISPDKRQSDNTPHKVTRNEILAKLPADIQQLPRRQRDGFVNQMLDYANQQQQLEARQREDDERVQWMIEQEQMGREVASL